MADEAIAQGPCSHLTDSVGNRFFTNPTAIRCSCAGIVQANAASAHCQTRRTRRNCLDYRLHHRNPRRRHIPRRDSPRTRRAIVTCLGTQSAASTQGTHSLSRHPGRTIGIFSTLHVLTGTFITNLSVSTGCIIFAEEFTCIIATDI